MFPLVQVLCWVICLSSSTLKAVAGSGLGLQDRVIVGLWVCLNMQVQRSHKVLVFFLLHNNWYTSVRGSKHGKRRQFGEHAKRRIMKKLDKRVVMLM